PILTGTVRVTSMVFMIILGSSAFSQILAFSGTSAGLTQWAVTLQVPSIVIVLAMMFVLLILGTLMESVSIMMLTVPVFFPLIEQLCFDPIWFGILFLLMIEFGLASPPFGMSLFVMLGVSPRGTRMSQVVYASIPFIGAAMLLSVLIIVFPKIVTSL